MTTPELVIWLVVLVVGLPSAWWNPTAGALVLSWGMGEAIYHISGDNLPTFFYLFGDAFVLMVIFAKAEQRFPLKGYRVQFCEILRDALCMDRFVLLIFPVMWVLYAAPLHPYYVWWALYFLVILQFLAAGWEALYPRPCDYPQVGDHKDTRLMCQAADDSA